jgi:ClpA/ClpB-like protein
MDLRNRFTARARNILTVAARDATRLNQKRIETEHLLLGLLSESSGVAASVLRNLRVKPSKMALEVERLATWGPDNPLTTSIPTSSASRNVIEYAIEEARNLNHDYVGTEHLLLGLLREKDGQANRILTDCGLTSEVVRAETLRVIAQGNASSDSSLPEDISLIGAEHEFFLGMYRSAVDFYKPRIEKRTGVQLGSIAVWDYARMHEHVTHEFMRRSPWFIRIVRSLVLRRRFRAYAQAIEAANANNASKCCAAYRGCAIYVSFGSNTPHEDAIASTTVHELAHAVWEKLEGRPLNMSRVGRKRRGSQEVNKYQLFVEGFATYAERIWFLDLYPVSIRRTVQDMQSRLDSVYFRGCQQIEQLVQNHGPKILLEIPKRWRSL